VLGRHFGAAGVTIRSGSAARPEAYLGGQPGSFSIVHFAAHAVANPGSPLDSTIVLSRGERGGRLAVRDVLGVPLDANLVTVSACRGVGARAYSGVGMVGFAWGFLTAGARQVVAGLWDVADRSTATLMDRMYAGMAAGLDAGAALRAAQLELARSGGARRPFHWAAFNAYLGPGPNRPSPL
jgi:CHAT domain-containing protein